MLSRIEVTDPPNAAPTEMDASISSGESGSMENVNGIRIAMAPGRLHPGHAPTERPHAVPKDLHVDLHHCMGHVIARFRMPTTERPRLERGARLPMPLLPPREDGGETVSRYGPLAVEVASG